MTNLLDVGYDEGRSKSRHDELAARNCLVHKVLQGGGAERSAARRAGHVRDAQPAHARAAHDVADGLDKQGQDSSAYMVARTEHGK